MELVSIVITTYGRTDSLLRAVKSALLQTYGNFEIIVVDDNQDEVIRSKVIRMVSSLKDPRIRLVLNPFNMGGALARNEGIKAARGKYVAFLDDDDEYFPLKVEKQEEIFEKSKNENLALVYCYCVQMKGKQIVRKYENDYVGNCIYEGMLDCIAATSQWMCRKEALLKVGMFTNMPCKQDSYLLLKLLVNGYEIDRVAEYLSVYHADPVDRISNSGGHEKRIIGEEKLRTLCREHYGTLSKKQRKEVEYRASCRLAEHYYGAKDDRAFWTEMKNIVRRPFREESLRTFRRLARIVCMGKG